MPSGAKKRKAAKKKKEQEANITSPTDNNNNITLGNIDLKSQTERESDGGGDSSPAAQNHHNQQPPFNEGNQESEMPDSSIGVDKKSIEEVASDKKGAVEVQVDDNGGQKISIEHVEFLKESNDGSSSSSSSDNESRVVEKAAHHSSFKATSQNGENKQVGSLPKETTQGIEKASFGKTDDSVVETDPSVGSVKPLLAVANEVINESESNSNKDSLAPHLVESRLKESQDFKRNEEEVIPLSEPSIEASWTVVEPVTNKNNGKSLSAAPSESSNGAGNIRDVKTTESSENQPLLASAPPPRVEQRTSWMSCCGLFDLLTGSGR